MERAEGTGPVTPGSGTLRLLGAMCAAIALKWEDNRPTGGLLVRPGVRPEDGPRVEYVNAVGVRTPFPPRGLSELRRYKDGTLRVMFAGFEEGSSLRTGRPGDSVDPARSSGDEVHIWRHPLGEPPEGYDYMLDSENHVGED